MATPVSMQSRLLLRDQRSQCQSRLQKSLSERSRTTAQRRPLLRVATLSPRGRRPG